MSTSRLASAKRPRVSTSHRSRTLRNSSESEEDQQQNQNAALDCTSDDSIGEEDAGEESSGEEGAVGDVGASVDSTDSIASAEAEPTAHAAMVESVTDYDDADNSTTAKKLATLSRKNNNLAANITRVSLENSRLREANATLCHALRQAQIPIPAGVQMVAQSVGAGHVKEVVPTLTGIAPPPTDITEVPRDQIPFCIRMCHLPDTSTIMNATRFASNPIRWPHAIATYLRTRETLCCIVEKRSKQLLE
jgi:hypothetical protein